MPRVFEVSRALFPLRAAALSVPVLLATVACAPPEEIEEPGSNPRTSFSFAPVTVEGIAPRWGAPVAPGFVIGGVDASMTVQSELLALEAVDRSLRGVPVATLSLPRFCACALFDSERRELLVVGGRDDRYADARSAEIVNVDTGEHIAIDAGDAASHPVGCQAFYSPSSAGGSGKGYVYGGMSSGSGFTDVTWRYDPEARTLTALDTAGPPARYDGSVHELDGGDALLVGGMGGANFNLSFFSDVWRFDAQTESWSEVATTSTDVPQGRRYPWAAVSPDESLLLYGFGSDSPRGESVLGDLWAFDLDAGTWAPLEVEAELPEARGFTYAWAGPEGTAGILAFGSNEDLRTFEDAWVLRVPDEHAGRWR